MQYTDFSHPKCCVVGVLGEPKSETEPSPRDYDQEDAGYTGVSPPGAEGVGPVASRPCVDVSRRRRGSTRFTKRPLREVPLFY